MYARAYMPPLGSSPPPPPRLPKGLGNQAPETKLAEAHSPKAWVARRQELSWRKPRRGCASGNDQDHLSG